MEQGAGIFESHSVHHKQLENWYLAKETQSLPSRILQSEGTVRSKPNDSPTELCNYKIC